MTTTPQFKFEFEQKKELELDIAGKTVIIPLDDETQKKQQMAILNFRDKYKKLEKKSSEYNFEAMTEDDVNEIFEMQRDIVKDVIVTILSEEEFNRLYEQAGNSIRNLMPVALFLVDVLTKEAKHFEKTAKEKYLTNEKVQSN